MTCPAAINRHYEARDQAWAYLASRGFLRSLEGWRNGRWIASVSCDDGGLQRIPDSHEEEAVPFWGSRAPTVQLESSMKIPAPVDLLDGGANSPWWRKRSPGEATDRDAILRSARRKDAADALIAAALAYADPSCGDPYPPLAEIARRYRETHNIQASAAQTHPSRVLTGACPPTEWAPGPTPGPDTLGRCETRRNLTGASLSQIRRSLAQAWRSMLGIADRRSFGRD